MIAKSDNKEEMLSIYTLKRFYQNKHMLLIGIGIREKSGEENTVIDIKDAFNISKIYAWKLLGGLEKDGLVEKKEKTKKKESMYGVTQEQIEVEYTPSSADAIPGFSTVLIMVILVFSVSILLSKYRKKY